MTLTVDEIAALTVKTTYSAKDVADLLTTVQQLHSALKIAAEYVPTEKEVTKDQYCENYDRVLTEVRIVRNLLEVME